MRLFDRQPLLIAAGWLFAVVLAVLVGVVGIGLVGADLTSRQGAPVSEDQVERELQGLGTAPPAPSATASPSSSRPATGRSFTFPAGTVVADCGRILSMAPAQGWAVHEQDDDEGEFRSVGDPRDRFEVELTCVGGVPQLRVAVED
ncbi:hypothetical protein AB0F81_23495 [Actinoplanes sp. NPDC024001]|uniref:hypothetical protein n=1 Tax=Actinoplanes sp. NPDC024001 TaxID=3154598 RepID=UPI0033CE315D